MAQPVIIYNASTGSNTLASGAGPATAIRGNSGASTGAYSGNGAGGGTQTIISLIGFTAGADLSGVATDGSHVLWLANTAGQRHMFKITAKDDGSSPKTVTVHAAPTTAISLGASAVAWAIGGKRLHQEGESTRMDWADALAGWTFQFEAGTYTFTAAIGPTTGDITNGPVTFRSSEPGVVQPVFECTTGINLYRPNADDTYHVIDGIKLLKTTGFVSHSAITSATVVTMTVRRCEVAGDFNYGFDTTGGTFFVEDCNVHPVSAVTVSSVSISSRCRVLIRRSSIHDGLGDGVYLASNAAIHSVIIEHCLIYDNGGDGIEAELIQANTLYFFGYNTIYGNTGAGIKVLTASPAAGSGLGFEGNSLVGNGTYGIDLTAAAARIVSINRNNHYNGNATAARNNLAVGAYDTSGDPLFVAVTDGAEDFTLGSGSPLIDAGAVVPTR